MRKCKEKSADKAIIAADVLDLNLIFFFYKKGFDYKRCGTIGCHSPKTRFAAVIHSSHAGEMKEAQR